MTAPMVLETDTFESWRDDALRVLVLAARTGQAFDAYTLEREHRLRQPPNPGAHWGALFRIAASRRLIEPVETRRTSRPTSKGSRRTTWRGLPNSSYPKATP